MVANDPPIQLGKNCTSSTRLYLRLLIMYCGTIAPPRAGTDHDGHQYGQRDPTQLVVNQQD